MKKVLITGGAGFVGHHLIEHILKTQPDWSIVSLDRFDSSGNPNRLADVEVVQEAMRSKRLRTVFWDLKAEINEQVAQQLGGPFDYILHLAAGSHVDRSIDEPMLFFMDNCIGTVNLMLYARDGGLVLEENFGDDPTADMPIAGRFLYFSTDEVYGPFPMDGVGGFKEWDRLNPNNPYAAAKAAAEMAVIAFANTYSIPMVITNTMNIFGERQHPEKFIPMCIKRSITGEKILIHANKDKTQAGLRHYLHVRNVSAGAVWAVQFGKLLNGSAEQGRYNVVGDVEMDNLQLYLLIHSIVRDYGREVGVNGEPFEIPEPDYELVDFHSSRPGHDLRYALDGGLIKSEGFEYPVSFKDSLRKMIYWTLDHKDQWL